MTVAVREDHMEMAEFLLKESADVNSVDQDQRLVLRIKSFDAHILKYRNVLVVYS